MTKINQSKQPNMAQLFAMNLDLKDGKADGKISANVWNKFVQGKGGKTIKYSITVENATRSISTYLAKNSQSTGKTKEALATSWSIQDSIEQEREKTLTPEGIEKDANAIKGFITGERASFHVSRHNAAQVFLKASDKFKDKKFPETFGTSLYLEQLYPTLVKKAKKLGISTYYKADYNFGNNIKGKLIACRELAMQISDKEKNILS